MRIELASLEDGKVRFSHQYSESELILEDDRVRSIAPPLVTGEVRKAERGAKVSGHVVGRVTVECDRCLKPLELSVDSRFKVEYVTAEEYRTQQDVELSEDDLDLAIFDGDAIDVDALVAEEILLAISDHWLCKDDCKGICPGCGADRNVASCGCDTEEVDPRWAGLKELVNKKNR